MIPPSPIRALMADAGHAAGHDMASIGPALATLAGDHELFAPMIASLPAGEFGVMALSAPCVGPQLLLVHRNPGYMAVAHSHEVWVALAPIAGAETHIHYRARPQLAGRADMAIADAAVLRPGQSVTLIPPDDVHSHGHIRGTGATPYTLVLLGGNFLAHRRKEYDLPSGTWHYLTPGDPGQPGRPASVASLWLDNITSEETHHHA